MKRLLLKPAISAIVIFSLLLTNFPSVNFNVAHADGASYTVSGAGLEAVNGTYVENGTSGDKPKYEYTNGDTTYVVIFLSNMWQIQDSANQFSSFYYNTTIDGNNVPSEGWTNNSGVSNRIDSDPRIGNRYIIPS